MTRRFVIRRYAHQVENAGALQPSGTRRLITPRPPRPPTMNPAFNTPGNTATASARFSTARGMLRSRVALICSKTFAAFSACFAACNDFLAVRGRSCYAIAATPNDAIRTMTRPTIAPIYRARFINFFLVAQTSVCGCSYHTQQQKPRPLGRAPGM